MDDNSWDIGVVVKNCNINRSNNFEAPNLVLESQNIKNDECNFIDRLLAAEVTNFDCLDELLPMNFSVAHQEKPDDQFSGIINSTTPTPIFVDQVKIMDQNDNQQLLQPIQSAQFSQQIFLPPPPPAIMCVPAAAAAPQKWIDLQQQLVGQANIHPTFTLSMRASFIQICRMKNKSTKFIYELIQEELTNDPWTWRKYGQKPIKGSPFPRNYYKCSTSKICQARKQIEKSSKDENLFLVAYSHGHNHPPPTKRSSIVGCNTCSKSKLPKGINIVPTTLSLNLSSLSSKRSKHSRVVASPISPTTPALEIENASPNKNEMVTIAEKNSDDEKERLVLIRNKSVNEDILMDFEELQGVSDST